jgi:hypothetical protein
MMKLTALIILNFTICLGTLHAEPVDSVQIEINEAKNLLKWAEKGYLCDSLISIEHDKNQLLREAIGIKDNQIGLSGDLIAQQIITIKRLKMGLVGLGSLAVLLAILGLV